MPIIEPEFMELTQGLDLEAFWEENKECFTFTRNKPRCGVEFTPDDHWIFGFVDVPSTIRYYHDKAYRDSLHKEVNQITRQYVGKTFFDEDTFENQPRRIENLFRCEFTYQESSTPWLTPGTDDPDEFARILDEAEATDMRAWALPEAYLREWEQRKREGRSLPILGEGSRGPATIITSVLKVETAIFWLYDHADLMRRFRDILADKMVELNTILREFSGNTQPGWWITDDNSALFNRALYREFCFPVLEKLLPAMAPGNARRYQHSDSAMSHLLEMQYALGIREVNYGPTIDVAYIREKMPDALIKGHMPPFTLRNGTPAEIQQRIREDFAKVGENGGLVMTTAGSTAAGTGVGRMRWYMQVVQDDCRYDRS
jgi:uroporphyrinogen decarboxylase